MGEDVTSRRPAYLASRRRLVSAARALFAEKGYVGTTTREIADRAGVAHMTVFRHFRTKAELFEESVVAPVRSELEDYVRKHFAPDRDTRDIRAETARFYNGLLEMMLDGDRLLQTLASALQSAPNDESGAELAAVMDSFLSQIVEMFERRVPVHDYAIDPAIVPRLLVGMAVSVGSHGHWLFPHGSLPPRDQLVDQMVKLTLHGLPGH